jgi:lauroyl/myristoyl acyltransferase
MALKTGVDHLRSGGLIGLALVESPDQATVRVPFFDGSLAVPRGIATMARRGRAPVIPLTATWREATPCVTFHAPLEIDARITDPAAADADLLGRLTATFETEARAAPAQGDLRMTEVIRQARATAASSSPAS